MNKSNSELLTPAIFPGAAIKCNKVTDTAGTLTAADCADEETKCTSLVIFYN